MEVSAALQVARREVSQHRAQEISREWANNPVDAATKFYILAKDTTENDTLLFDEANLLARAIGDLHPCESSWWYACHKNRNRPRRVLDALALMYA